MKTEKRKIVNVKFVLTQEESNALYKAYEILEKMDYVICEEDLGDDTVEVFFEGKTETIESRYLSEAMSALYEII